MNKNFLRKAVCLLVSITVIFGSVISSAVSAESNDSDYGYDGFEKIITVLRSAGVLD